MDTKNPKHYKRKRVMQLPKLVKDHHSLSLGLKLNARAMQTVL
jgi:hypothetical protein